jgi:hypothetical protein
MRCAGKKSPREDAPIDFTSNAGGRRPLLVLERDKPH